MSNPCATARRVRAGEEPSLKKIQLSEPPYDLERGRISFRVPSLERDAFSAWLRENREICLDLERVHAVGGDDEVVTHLPPGATQAQADELWASIQQAHRDWMAEGRDR